MSDQTNDLTFTIGITSLSELARAKGYQYEIDAEEERVIRGDGTVVIRAPRKPPHLRGPKRKDPTVWMRAIKPHTYHGHTQDEGSFYLANAEDVENIENLRFAVREREPRRAVRTP